MRYLPFFLQSILLITALSGSPLLRAHEEAPGFIAEATGIYRVDAKGQRSLVAKPKSDEIFVDSSLSISPNEAWALVDHLPRKPGAGRVAEERVLISLRNGARIDAEGFNKKYGAWLSELADWDPDAPSTLEMETGKKIPIR